MTPEELAAAKAAQEQAEKEAAEKAAKEKENQTPQNLEAALAELAKVRDALTAANHEAADRRKKLKAFEDADEKRKTEEQKKRDAELSEVERLKKEKEAQDAALQKHLEQLKAERARNAFERAVRVKKVEFDSDKQEADAYKVFAESLTFDDDGNVKDPDKTLEAMLKERPYLAKQLEPTPKPKLSNNNATSGNGGKGQDEEARKKELAQRFRIKI